MSEMALAITVLITVRNCIKKAGNIGYRLNKIGFFTTCLILQVLQVYRQVTTSGGPSTSMS